MSEKVMRWEESERANGEWVTSTSIGREPGYESSGISTSRQENWTYVAGFEDVVDVPGSSNLYKAQRVARRAPLPLVPLEREKIVTKQSNPPFECCGG
jgi:hypothetical protein